MLEKIKEQHNYKQTCQCLSKVESFKRDQNSREQQVGRVLIHLVLTLKAEKQNVCGGAESDRRGRTFCCKIGCLGKIIFQVSPTFIRRWLITFCRLCWEIPQRRRFRNVCPCIWPARTALIPWELFFTHILKKFMIWFTVNFTSLFKKMQPDF